MAFELPFPPFPHDSRDVPFIATPDDNNGYTVPSSQYFKKLVGDKYIWTPVSADDPLPTSDATMQTRIGEVQAAPTANTLLARLKSLEDKIDKITAGTTPAVTTLSGSNLPLTQPVPSIKAGKVVVDTIWNAKTIQSNSALQAQSLGTTNETELYLLIWIDRQPWTLYGDTAYMTVAETRTFYPITNNLATAYTNSYSPRVVKYLNWVGVTGDVAPTKISEAIALPMNENRKFSLIQTSGEVATVTVKVVRIWR